MRTWLNKMNHVAEHFQKVLNDFRSTFGDEVDIDWTLEARGVFSVKETPDLEFQQYVLRTRNRLASDATAYPNRLARAHGGPRHREMVYLQLPSHPSMGQDLNSRTAAYFLIHRSNDARQDPEGSRANTRRARPSRSDLNRNERIVYR